VVQRIPDDKDPALIEDAKRRTRDRIATGGRESTNLSQDTGLSSGLGNDDVFGRNSGG
jgi:hypothetical protein